MNMNRKEVADIIEGFISGSGGERDWDDFISIRLKDPELEEIRRQCAVLPEKYPPMEKRAYCGPEGIGELRNIARQIKM